MNDEPNTKAQVAGVSHAALLAEVEALSKDLDRFIEQDAKKPGTVKIQSMQSRMSEYSLMKGKLEFYAETLGMHQDQVRGKLAELELQAKRLIDAATNAVSSEMDTAEVIS